MTEQQGTSRKAAILIVNGGENAAANRWIKLCLERIVTHTIYPDYHIYVWNNRHQDRALEAWLLDQPRLTLLSAAGYENLHHPHRTPLQRLYHLARSEGTHYVVALDSDAHPLRAGWLTEQLAALDKGAALAGIWRAEMVPSIRPHVHASCLCTTVGFVEDHHLRFDFDNTHSTEKTDTLAHFTWVAEAEGLPIYRLERSNQRSFHYWMGGIYGDLVYHHVAASRERVLFHNTPTRDRFQIDAHQQLKNETGELLFSGYDTYMSWLQGKEVLPKFQQNMDRLRAIADDHRSVRWWLDRALSTDLRRWLVSKIRMRIRARATSNPLASKLMWKTERAVRRAANALPHSEQKVEPQPLDAMATSFKQEHLYPLPAHGWTAKPPDFVGIGAPKSGTSFFHSLLMQHPQIVHRAFISSTRRERNSVFSALSTP
ncbi:MAG: hypothetical protein R2856_37560 [Caldilineaceae bacterium]